MAIDTLTKKIKQDNWRVTFSDNDDKLVIDNGNDPIVISAIIKNYCVDQILVNNGNVVEILQWNAFQKMGYREIELHPLLPIYGFANQPVVVKGSITLLLTLGDGKHTAIVMVEFLVVEQPSTYYVILE